MRQWNKNNKTENKRGGALRPEGVHGVLYTGVGPGRGWASNIILEEFTLS